MKTLFGANIKNLEKRTIDRFRYYFVYDFDKYTQLSIDDCLGACKAFYKIESKLPLDESDKDFIGNYLTIETEKLRSMLEGMGIKLNNIGYQTALENVEKIRTETTITTQHLDIEIVQVAPNDYFIFLIINLIF